jgi:HSP20 family protein
MRTHVVRNDHWPAREMVTEWPPFVVDENQESYVFCATVPGFDLSHVTVRVCDGQLVVLGEPHDGAADGAPGRAADDGFERVFALSSKVDRDDVHYALNDGRLTIVLKKAPCPSARWQTGLGAPPLAPVRAVSDLG